MTTRITEVTAGTSSYPALVVSAHDTWLTARRTSIAVGQTIQLDLTSGMAFPTVDYAIKPDRIAASQYRLNGKTLPLGSVISRRKSLIISVQPHSPGLAVFWVELKPKSLELDSKQVNEYFDEINAPAAVREFWANGGTNQR